MASDNLELDQLTGSENEKTNLINDIFQQMEDAMTEKLSKAITGATTLSDAEALRNMVFEFTGTPGSAQNVVVPDNKKLYLCENSVTDGSVLTVKTSTGSGVALKEGVQKILYCDGTNVIEVGRDSRARVQWAFGDNTPTSADAGLTAVGGAFVGTAGNLGYVAIRDGDIVGVSVCFQVTAQTTPGNLIFRSLIEGSNALSVTVAVSGTGYYVGSAVADLGAHQFNADDRLGFWVDFTSSVFVGTIDDSIVTLEASVLED